VAAGARFADVGMPEVADDDPPPIPRLETFRRGGRLWVATAGPGPGEQPVGYAMARVVDRCGHLEQLSVVREHGGRGLGRRLVDHVAGWAVARGLPALTLSTFRDVPWNGPWYEHLGFVVVPDTELGPGLRATRRRERHAGLDVSRRQFLRRPTALAPAA
jgi:GNAT superfamily N-acetyltransferase